MIAALQSFALHAVADSMTTHLGPNAIVEIK